MFTIEHIREMLHFIAESLMWPVMTGLLLAMAMTLIATGGVLRELIQRVRKSESHFLAAGKKRLSDAALNISESNDDLQPLDMHLEKILIEQEQYRLKSLSHIRLAIRIGPALGLMGTLIPMAHALGGLSEGDFQVLTENMVTAFAATVIGLSISALAYLLSIVRENWARAEGHKLAFHAESILLKNNESSPS